MEALGNIQPVVIRVPQPASQPVLPTASSDVVLPAPINTASMPNFNSGDAEYKRFEALKSAARNAPQPLGSQVVTLFKDATGQIITRFRDTNSGKVTYIPEPDLLQMTANRAASALSLLDIFA